MLKTFRPHLMTFICVIPPFHIWIKHPLFQVVDVVVAVAVHFDQVWLPMTVVYSDYCAYILIRALPGTANTCAKLVLYLEVLYNNK